MTEYKVQKLFKFKRESEVIIAKAMREMMKISDDSVLNSDIFYPMSAEIMRLVEDNFE